MGMFGVGLIKLFAGILRALEELELRTDEPPWNLVELLFYSNALQDWLYFKERSL